MADTPTAPEPELVRLLATRDAPCPACGYSLRGVSEPRCPECGERLTFDALVANRGGRAGAWVVMLVALAAGLPESVLKWQRLLLKPDGRLFYGDSRFWLGSPSRFGYVHPSAAGHPAWWEWLQMAGSYAFWLGIPAWVVAVFLLRRRIEHASAPVRWGFAALLMLAAIFAHRRMMFWYVWWWDRWGRAGDTWWL